MTEPMIWCGSDPGLAKFGVAYLLRQGGLWHALKVHTVTTVPADRMGKRLVKIRYSLLKQPALEPKYVGTAIGFAYESQLGARMGHRERGDSNYNADLIERVIGLIWERSLMEFGSVTREEPVEVTPGFIRKSLGLSLRATKKQVANMVRRMVLGLPADLDEHACDAAAIAIAGERRWSLDQAVAKMVGKGRLETELRKRAQQERKRQ